MRVLKRKRDDTYWTLNKADTPFPFGYDFIRIKKVLVGWWIFKLTIWKKDKSERWVFSDPMEFDIIN